LNFENILYFNLALIVAMLSPGPAFLLSIQTTLSSGRSAGISLGCGLALMASIWTGSALLGLETVFYLFPWAYSLIKVIGALYLIYIALQMWRGSKKKLTEKNKKQNSYSFRQGILVNVLNPKSVLFAASVLVLIFPPNMSLVDNMCVVLNHFIVEVIFYTCLAFTMSIDSIRLGYMNLKQYIDRTSSVVLGSLGLRILIDHD